MVNSKLSALFVRNCQQLIKQTKKIQPQPNSIRIGKFRKTFQCSISIEKTPLLSRLKTTKHRNI